MEKESIVTSLTVNGTSQVRRNGLKNRKNVSGIDIARVCRRETFPARSCSVIASEVSDTVLAQSRKIDIGEVKAIGWAFLSQQAAHKHGNAPAAQ